MNNNRTGLEVAVIGMSCKFNGVQNYQEFWNQLKEGKELVSFLTKEDIEKNNLPDKLINNKNFIRATGQIKDKNEFDISFFGISPRDASKIPPQAFLLYEAAWNALEDGGYSKEKVKERIGIYCGTNSTFISELTTFLSLAIGNDDDISSVFLSNKDYIPSYIAYKLNLTGPAISIDTACSSSLVAVHLACQAILNGDCSMALAGGASVHPLDKNGYLFQENGIYSSDGHTRPFDNEATGTINSEGSGMLLLKSLEDAIRDKDNIHGIIKGSAINNDGKQKIGYSAPSMRSQSKVIKDALKVANISHTDVSYIAAHGSGTIVGDPIEIQALKTVFGKSDTKYCYIGSVKANLGHTIHASGVASLIKVICAMNGQSIPPLINHSMLNTNINLEDTPFSFVTGKSVPWIQNDKSTYAGVSSFGIGGTNAHVIVEKYLDKSGQSSESNGQYNILTLSAKTPSALETMEDNLKSMISQEKLNLSDIAYTLNTGRIHFPYRKFALVKHNDEKNDIRFISAPIDLNKQNFKGNIFVFSGLGNQLEEIALEFYQNEKKFKESFDLCSTIIVEYAKFDLIKYIKSDRLQKDISEFEIEQLITFSFEYSYSMMLIQLGVIPDKVIGYSFGEYTAACISGIIELSDSIKLITERGKLIAATQSISMINIPMSSENLTSILKKFDHVYITIDNIDSCVVVGGQQEIDKVIKLLLKQRIMCVQMSGTHGIHSQYMNPIAEQYKEILERISFSSPKIPFISGTAQGQSFSNQQFNMEYWAQHLTKSVNFGKSILLLSREKYHYTMIGYGSELAPLLKRLCYEKAETIYFVKQNPALKNSSIRAFYFQLASLWNRGYNLDWEIIHEGNKVNKKSLPTYPFERKKVKEDLDLFQFIEYLKGGNSEGLQALFQSSDSEEEQGLKSQFNALRIEENKIDRFSLSSEYIKPQNKIQEELIFIWEDLFGFSEIGIDDDFVELGGDSLKSIKVTNIISDNLNKKISPKWFFKNRTVASLAKFIIENEEDTEQTVIPKATITDKYEILPTQKIIYQICRDNDFENFIVSKSWTLKGELDAVKFKAAVDKAIQTFSLLRTSFIDSNGRIMAKVCVLNEDYDSIQLHMGKCVESIVADSKKNLSKRLKNGQCPLFEINIFKNSDNEYKMSFLYYSFLLDGFSTIDLIQSIMRTYMNREMAKPKIQFIDYAEYVNANVNMLENPKGKEFWENVINGDIQYITRNTIYNPQEMICEIGNDLKENLLKSAHKNKTTINSLLVITFNMVLCKFFNEKRLKLGMITSHKELDTPLDTIGYYTRIIPLLIDTHETLDNMLLRFNEFQEYASYPFERICASPYHELRSFYKYLVQFHDVHEIEEDELVEMSEDELVVLDQKNEWDYFPCSIKLDIFKSESNLSFCFTLDNGELSAMNIDSLRNIFLDTLFNLAKE